MVPGRSAARETNDAVAQQAEHNRRVEIVSNDDLFERFTFVGGPFSFDQVRCTERDRPHAVRLGLDRTQGLARLRGHASLKLQKGRSGEPLLIDARPGGATLNLPGYTPASAYGKLVATGVSVDT